MTSATAEREANGGVTRLVEAERRWAIALVDARARAATIVAEAEAAAAEAARQADQALGVAVDERRREQDASLDGLARTARDELAARASRYTGAGDAVVDRIAASIADRAPWFRPPEAR